MRTGTDTSVCSNGTVSGDLQPARSVLNVVDMSGPREPHHRDPTDAGLLLAHGFTQNANCWGAFPGLLAGYRTIKAVDAPGHGPSGFDDADLWQAAMLTSAVEADVWLGYSMGARVLLHAALAASDRSPVGTPRHEGAIAPKGLVLIGGTAGIEDEAERLKRFKADAVLADRCRSIGTEAFVDRWLASPLFDRLTAAQACRQSRLVNRADGLARSLERCGVGSQLPLWSRLGELSMPVLVIAGTADTKFTTIGRRLVEAVGSNALFAPVDGGHATHLENPAGVADVVNRFLVEVA